MGRILAGQCCLGGFLGKGVCAMMSRQWSSNTLKQGIDLLGSQCTDSQTGTADLDEMIRAHWINYFSFQQIFKYVMRSKCFSMDMPCHVFPHLCATEVQEERIRRMQTELQCHYRRPEELRAETMGDPGTGCSKIYMRTFSNIYSQNFSIT